MVTISPIPWSGSTAAWGAGQRREGRSLVSQHRNVLCKGFVNLQSDSDFERSFHRKPRVTIFAGLAVGACGERPILDLSLHLRWSVDALLRRQMKSISRETLGGCPHS